MNFKIMNWNRCKKEFIRKVEKDKFHISSLKEMAEKRFVRARTQQEESFIIEDYYEGIKELLVAYLLKKGLKSSNHQCLFSFLYNNYPDKEKEIKTILQLSFFRNRLNYYGEKVPKNYLKEKRQEIEKIINWIKSIID